jgi:hypothetical protein
MLSVKPEKDLYAELIPDAFSTGMIFYWRMPHLTDPVKHNCFYFAFMQVMLAANRNRGLDIEGRRSEA